jgi:preprotein translocase subunit SecG
MELILQKSVKYRTSIMLLVAFNMVSAVVLIGLVLFDSSRLAKKAALLGTG